MKTIIHMSYPAVKTVARKLAAFGALTLICATGLGAPRALAANGGTTDPQPAHGKDCASGRGHHGCVATDPDSDGDGLTNSQEAGLGTNPNNPDTDADGLSDGAEVNTHGTNPLAADTD